MTALRVDVVVVQNLPWSTWIARVLEVEALGYDGVWVWDHLVHRTQEPTDPLHEGFTTLAAAAALTSRIRIGTLVASPVLRSPLLLAKAAMTVDQVSGGRFDLGIGAGGSLLDSAALGIAQPTAGELAGRFEQTVELLDVDDADDAARVAGEHPGLRFSTGWRVLTAPQRLRLARPPQEPGRH